MVYDTTYFECEASKMGVSLSKEQIDQFIMFYEMLIEKNKVMNLTGITEFDEVIEKHFLDSISLCKAIDISKDLSVLDLGTGAGFPGIPLKIAFPNFDITLVDSLNKRVGFLNEVIEKLELRNIRALHSRAEELGRNKNYREKYDLCVSRAVANLSSLSEYCTPFLKIGGLFVSYKGGACNDEVKSAFNALKKLSSELLKIESFDIGDNSRSLVVIKKVSNTKKAYPRKAGTPTKDPL